MIGEGFKEKMPVVVENQTAVVVLVLIGEGFKGPKIIWSPLDQSNVVVLVLIGEGFKGSSSMVLRLHTGTVVVLVLIGEGFKDVTYPLLNSSDRVVVLVLIGEGFKEDDTNIVEVAE